MEKVTVFAPNTVANVGCGYDVLGFALEGHGDEITLTKRGDDRLVITDIMGADLPTEPDKNVATVAIAAMLEEMGQRTGFDMVIKKSIPPGSGLGSSASSAAGAVFAANELLGRPFSRTQLVAFAMEGERSSSGVAHADNVAPCLLGGFTVVRSYHPLDVFSIPFPAQLRAVVMYPNVEMKTADAKRILKKQILLSDAVTQWGNVAGLVSGLITGDMARVGRSMQDVIIEPVRSMLIPFYSEVKAAAQKSGALGFAISGSGPSTFAFTDDIKKAETILAECTGVYARGGIPCIGFISSINQQGVRVI